MAKANPYPFRFSTKYQDDETDLLYYGYRFYSATTGRWLSCDPLGEESFLRIVLTKRQRQPAPLPFERSDDYCFLRNAPLGTIDPTGLKPCSECQAGDIQRLAISLGREHIYASIEERREYGGYICCATNACSLTRKATPVAANVVLGPVGPPFDFNIINSRCPKGTTPVADWHTHPDGSMQLGEPNQPSPDKYSTMSNADRLRCDYVGFMTNARLLTTRLDATGGETTVDVGP